MKGRKIDGLYQLQRNTVLGTAAVASSSGDKDADTTRLWHMRLGHISERGLQILSKTSLLAGVKSGKPDFCEHCVYGKQCRVKFSTAIHKTNGVLDYIHSDLWGPSSQVSLGGSRYIMTLIDDYSCHTPNRGSDPTTRHVANHVLLNLFPLCKYQPR
ncbi:gag_pre-integrs domain-containing protein [Cephalotus follicularis]|uniref:Gag_pre-integrs domain-containing protein n=1 Tax=Cephalotus follicularis TaxID=3775 RepID=A0A1Q3BT24_CEPFO|nr:gag_pre-integrs domain-containing protein [Cephalotus follicularis]